MYLNLPIVEVTDLRPLNNGGGGSGSFEGSLMIIPDALEIALAQRGLYLERLGPPEGCAWPKTHLYRIRLHLLPNSHYS